MTMELDERQYERIARWLDGEAVELTAAERHAADEIAGLEEGVGAAMNVQTPLAAMERARMRMRAAAATPRYRLLRIGTYAAAAAAAVLFITTALPTGTPNKPAMVGGVASGEVPLDVWVQSMNPPADSVAITLVAEQADSLAADMAAAKPMPAVDRGIESLQQDIKDMWLDNQVISQLEG